MPNYYVHPNLYTKELAIPNGTVLDLEKGEMVDWHPHPVSGDEYQIYHDFEKYFNDLARMTAWRKALKIPDMTYHAHTFDRIGYDVMGVGKLIAWARKRYETRWWINYRSALLLIAIADTDLSENAGWEFYQKGKDIPERRSFALPAWWEFCQNGTQIPPNWILGKGRGGDLVTATSPDKKYAMVIGGI